MREHEASKRSNLARLFSGTMILIGIYAALRYGGEWAYVLGKLMGSN